MQSNDATSNLDARELRLRVFSHDGSSVGRGPAVYPRVELVRNSSGSVDGPFGTVRGSAGV
jgi:hypothetical protein